VKEMHKTTSNRIIVATASRDVGMKHAEQNVIEREEVCGITRVASLNKSDAIFFLSYSKV
jgi:hypothetical protein